MSAGAVVLLTILAVIVCVVVWAIVWSQRDKARLAAMPPEQAEAIRQERRAKLAQLQAQQKARKAAAPAPKARSISVAGDTSTGTLACPKCKGTQFKAKRRGLAKAATLPLAIAMPLVPKTRVKCVTCGTEYLRK